MHHISTLTKLHCRMVNSEAKTIHGTFLVHLLNNVVSFNEIGIIFIKKIMCPGGLFHNGDALQPLQKIMLLLFLRENITNLMCPKSYSIIIIFFFFFFLYLATGTKISAIAMTKRFYERGLYATRRTLMFFPVKRRSRMR